MRQETSAVSREALLDRARGLLANLQRRGAETSQTRRVPDDLMKTIADSGLMRLARPRKYGGPEVGQDILYEVARELARGDGSISWVYAVLAAHDHFIGHFPGEVQDEYWSSTVPQCASSFVPFGKATRRTGGYTLNGKWSFCSGVDFVGWAIVGAVVGMRKDDAAKPDLRYFLVRKSDFRIIDDWFAAGLAGTGSKSIVLEDAFVPDSRVVSDVDVSTGTAPGSRVHSNPVFRTPLWSVLTFSLSAPAAGIAQGAYEALAEEFRGRMGQPEPIFHSKLPAIQLHLAEASALIRAATLLWGQALNETFALIRSGESIPLEQRVNNRRDVTHSVLMARQASEILLGMSGARGLNNDGRVQRAVRDIFACSVHPGLNSDWADLSFGAVALGCPPTDMYY